jgi:hypothetical protein
MKNILFFNNHIHKEKQTLNDVGRNYGNMCFYYATLEIFRNHNIHFISNPKDNPDIIVISIANAICNIESCINYLNYISKYIFKYKCKKILLSIGAQNNNLNMFYLEERNKNIINNFFKQLDFINLRGTYTKDLLLFNGINYDYKILGCPSIYLCKPMNKNIKQLNSETKILFNGPRINSFIKKKTQPNCEFIFNLINDLSVDFLYQDSFSKNNKNIIIPQSFNIWKNTIKKYDFVIGTRIHGAIMSLICNVPTLLIVIDSRTHELAEIFKIPYINIIDKGIDLKNKEDIIKLVNNHLFDYTDYNKYLCEYNKNLKSLLLDPFNL